MPGVSDATFHLAECCNIDLVSIDDLIEIVLIVICFIRTYSNNQPPHDGFYGQIGNGLEALEIPRNQNALVNNLGYGVTDTTNDAFQTRISKRSTH